MLRLAAPIILVLIPLPLFFRWLMPSVKNQAQNAINVPFFETMKSLYDEVKLKSVTSFSKKMILPSLIWILLCLALSGPQWLGPIITLPRSGRDIMLVLDLSGSMRTPDMELRGHYFNRLAVVKIAARKFIQARTSDRMGLILFGSKAYLQTPLTFDHKTVLQMLDDATVGLAGTQTAIGDAVGLAIKRLQNAKGKSKIIILLTDGGNNAGNVMPLVAAKIAKELGIKIFTIGLGAQQIVVQSLFGPEVIHHSNALDEKTLKEMAKLTGGIFFRAESGSNLQQVYARINQLVPTVTNTKTVRPLKPLYPWPLALALFLSIFLFITQYRPWNFFMTRLD